LLRTNLRIDSHWSERPLAGQIRRLGAQIRAKSPRASKAGEAGAERAKAGGEGGKVEGRNEGGIDALPYKAGKEHRVVVLVAPHVRVGAAHLCPARQDAKEEAWRRR
jgi:hypothetical protein